MVPPGFIGSTGYALAGHKAIFKALWQCRRYQAPYRLSIRSVLYSAIGFRQPHFPGSRCIRRLLFRSPAPIDLEQMYKCPITAYLFVIIGHLWSTYKKIRLRESIAGDAKIVHHSC